MSDKAVGKDGPVTWKISREQWAEIDWENRTANEIAVILKCTAKNVYRAAKKYGYKPKDGRTTQKGVVNWSAVDWSRSNIVIAEKHGVTRQRVSVMRPQKAPPRLRRAPRTSRRKKTVKRK